MPEIRLGGLPNMDNIQLGSIQIEEVRIGTELVWRNNLPPEFTSFTLDGSAIANNSNQTVFRATPFTIAWTAQDMEPAPDPSDNIVTFRVYENDTLIQTIPANTPSPTESGTYSISGAFYDDAAEAGTLATPRTWRVEAEDDQGSTGRYQFNITTLDFTAPVITPGSLTIIGSADSHNFPYTVTPNANAINLTTTPNSSIDIPAACTGFDVDTTNTVTMSVNANTTGGGLTRNATPVMYTYSRIESRDSAPTRVGSEVNSGAAFVNNLSTPPCVASDTSVSCGEVLATCTNQPGTVNNRYEQRRGFNTQITSTLLCDMSVTALRGGPFEFTTSNFFQQTDSCNTASYANPGMLPVFMPPLPTITQVASGTGACAVTCSTGTPTVATIAQGGSMTVNCSGTIPSGFQGGAAGDTFTGSNTTLACNMLNAFTCADSGFAIADGNTGDQLNTLITLTDGTLARVESPAGTTVTTLRDGLQTYTGIVNIPATGFSNSGQISCPVTATGTTAVPEITGCDNSLANGEIQVGSGGRVSGELTVNITITPAVTTTTSPETVARSNSIFRCTQSGGATSGITGFDFSASINSIQIPSAGTHTTATGTNNSLNSAISNAQGTPGQISVGAVSTQTFTCVARPPTSISVTASGRGQVTGSAECSVTQFTVTAV